MNDPISQDSAASSSKLRRRVLIVAAVAIILGIWGVADRLMTRADLAKEGADSAIVTVTIVKPTHSATGEDLILPGNVQAYYDAPIYARTSGYLKAWYTDIGTPVKKGQLLAEIDTPEIDQQLRQAQADLATAQANYTLALSTNSRWQGLLATESVSKQDADEKAGDAAAKKSAVASAEANLARLHDLESFKRVTAPFDGTVVSRTTDIGALINAGQSNGAELFRVSDTRKLRIFVQVPQPDSTMTIVGLQGDLTFAEHPGKAYPARIVHTAKALDPASRSLQVELQVDNANGELFPGAYTEVRFKLPARAEVLRLPPNTVLFRSAGLQVATVGADNHVTLKNIVQGRDFGKSIEILSGLSANDQVILNPPDSISTGTPVHAVVAPEKASAPQSAAQPPKDKSS